MAETAPWENSEFNPASEKAPWENSAFEPPNVAEDVVKSTGVGVGKGLISLAGLPGDVAEYGARGINAAVQGVGRLTGLDVGPSRESEEEPTLGSAQIQRGVESVTGPFRKPETTWGKYGETFGEFVPAVIGGPETLAVRLARRALVPGLAAETAGQATEKVAPEYADMARTATGLVTGLRFKGTKNATPTMAEHDVHATNIYQSPEIAAVKINPNAAHREVVGIKRDLEDITDPDLMKGTWALLNKAEDKYAPVPTDKMAALTGVKPTAKPDVEVQDLNTLKKQLNKIARDYSSSRPGEDRMAATVAIKKIDGYLDNLAQPDLIAGDAGKAIGALREANASYATARRMETVDKKVAAALLRAGSTYSGANVENAIRQNLRRIIDPDSAAGKRLRGGWSEAELARAKEIVEGGEVSNILRELGNRLSGLHGTVGGTVGGVEALAHGRPGLAATLIGAPIAGRAVRGLGNLRTYKQAKGLSEMLSSRSPLAEKWREQGKKAPIPPFATPIGAASYLTPMRDDPLRVTVGSHLFQQQGGRVEGYEIGSPEFKEEVRQALLRNPDSPARAQAQRNRRDYLPNSPESINIEDRRGQRGAYSQRARADYQDGGTVLEHPETAEFTRRLRSIRTNPEAIESFPESENVEDRRSEKPPSLPEKWIREYLAYRAERARQVEQMYHPQQHSSGLGHEAGFHDVGRYQRGGAVTVTSRTGRHSIPVEIASTAAQQAKGLSGRRTLGKGRGMLFTLPSARPTSFWMNKTHIPLDMIFIRADGRIAKIAENRRPLSRERVLSGGPVSKVLEVAAGTARRLRLMPGDKVQ